MQRAASRHAFNPFVIISVYSWIKRKNSVDFVHSVGEKNDNYNESNNLLL